MECRNKKTERRTFLSWFTSLSMTGLAASVVYPLFRFLSPPDVPEAATNQVEAGNVGDPDLLEKGFKIVRFGVEPVILIQLGDRDYRAFSATCTHLDCIVEYQKGEERIWCNCHNGAYDLTGRNIAGPPPKPLNAFAVNLVAQNSGQPEAIVISRS